MSTIVCYGDSNTWGLIPPNHPTDVPERHPKMDRWYSIMADRLGNDIEVIAEGLSGRTTVFDDTIEGIYRNGQRAILCAIESHAPVDLLIVMLGTNDFKSQFGHTAYISARGILTLIELVQGHFVLSEKSPEILVVTPCAISENAEIEMWGNAAQRSKNHAGYLAQVAERTGCFHFDANKVAKVGNDGIHLTKVAHRKLGEALADQSARILQLANSH